MIERMIEWIKKNIFSRELLENVVIALACGTFAGKYVNNPFQADCSHAKLFRTCGKNDPDCVSKFLMDYCCDGPCYGTVQLE